MAGERFLSIPFLVLRLGNAGGALVAGLIQTFVFARILSAERFSIFILVGTLGVSLWLFDLGIAKIVFVKMRAWYLGARRGRTIARHATAVVAFYAALVLVGTLLCGGLMAAYRAPLQEALEFGLFFAFTALTLVWFALRNISIAVDEFVRFESLEAIRRVGHIVLTLLMLAGLPLMNFLIAANLLWVIVLAISIIGLIRRKRALVPTLAATPRDLSMFLRDNRSNLLRTGTYALSEFYIYNFPYAVVPYAFGLGSPTIVIDTAFKILRGATVLFSAGSDVAVPRQTSAFAKRDRRTLTLATMMAFGLCCIPALALALLLLFAGDRVFALLLGNAATMPPAIIPLLVIMLFANLVQTVSNFLLVHTGFFKEIAQLAKFMMAAMTVMTAFALLMKFDLVGFLTGYTIVYCAGAALYVLLAIRGPILKSGQR